MDLISLSQFCAGFKGVSLATSEDSAELCDFFETKAMKGETLTLTYLRRPDFFGLLKAHSQRFYVFILRSPSGEIIGAGSIVVRRARHIGQTIDVAYLGDLRVTKPKLSARIWRDFYLTLLNQRTHISELKDCRYFYTCILEDNQLAQKALETKSPLGYHLFERYQMVNVFYQKPWARMKSALTCVTHPPPADILSFLRNCPRPLGFDFEGSDHEWQWREHHWPGFSDYPSFGIYQAGELIAFSKLWSPSLVKKIRLDRLPKVLQFFFQLLSPVIKLPRQGEEFRVVYLSLLTFKEGIGDQDRQDAMSLLLSKGLKWSKGHGFHALSFADFESFSLKPSVAGYLTHKTPLKLYFVDPTRNPVSDFSKMPAPSGFEMSLV